MKCILFTSHLAIALAFSTSFFIAPIASAHDDVADTIHKANDLRYTSREYNRYASELEELIRYKLYYREPVSKELRMEAVLARHHAKLLAVLSNKESLKAFRSGYIKPKH